jgi:hypothetical protein
MYSNKYIFKSKNMDSNFYFIIVLSIYRIYVNRYDKNYKGHISIDQKVYDWTC